MSALAKVEIAASPTEVRKVFLDFTNWSEIGDPVIRSMTPSSTPLTKGSKIVANFAGHKLDLLVLENTAQTFSWHTNMFNILTGNRTFQFLPSEKTPGHTTFVNGEKFGRLFWVLVTTGIMKEQAAFETFNAKFKSRVEERVSARGM